RRTCCCNGFRYSGRSHTYARNYSDKGIPGFGILAGIMGILVAVYSRKK
ncbi:MAG: hypothetical protein K8R34_04310, partial [Methanosarcinales archaeon]|nr:hypothetical protein [Methanosarcinales archaeon]